MPKKSDKPYILQKKRSGRYAVLDKNGKYINGDAKTEILLKEGVVKKPPKKSPKKEAAEE